MDRGWEIIEAHPWNLLGKFDLLFHPWKFDLFPRLDGLFVLRLKRLFQASKSFEVMASCNFVNALTMASAGVTVGCVIYLCLKTPCLPAVSLVSSSKKPRVFCNVLQKSSDKIHPPNAHQRSFVCLVLYGTGQHIPWAQVACDYNRNCCDDTPMQRC